MGNASSTQSSSSQPQSTSSAQPPAATPSQESSSTGPIITPQPIRTRAPTGGTSTFHSGLTPPVSPPSPPPPSTPVLLPYAGHLSPQNPHCLSHPQAHDYSKGTVTRLILDGKLAPFYRGLEDFEEDWSEDEILKLLNETREKDYEEGVENTFTKNLKDERDPPNSSTVGSVAKKIGAGLNKQKAQRREGEREERVRRERKAYRFAVECPICFLNYPPNINTSRCCQQPVCTECFVQIKRSEATLTHLESDPACCPFCMETDFGVIYERPLSPLDSSSSVALATSPGSEFGGGDSSFSQALSLGSEAELNVGPGMNPKMKETVRRKSVSSKAKEVVTIDEIRPDWETKLNAVKAAAARKASRRIVMRQVGDRLIPIGFTSSRAPGTADFSMSVGQQNSEAGSRRSSRRSSNRERELEELMIEEAMRLSLMDHEDHQRKLADERRKSSVSSVSSPLNPANSSAPNPNSTPIIVTSSSQGGPGPSSIISNRRSSNADTSTKSKLLSKINHVRARASSSASSKNGGNGSGDYRSVTFAGSSNNGSPRPSPPTSATPSRTNTSDASPVPAPAPPVVIPQPTHIHTHGHGHSKHPTTTTTGLSPTSPAPIAAGPITTLASPPAERINHTHGTGTEGGLPRISLDMPALTPDSNANVNGNGGIKGKQPVRPTHLERMDSEMSEATVGPGNYAQLDSDEE
ncbi:hypothetical protein I302_105210 [Kwoniella bestiolae CBS 10118]|uniref:Zf-C3HC4 type zinc finger protein n=1 Tax=Kwoniella bestiolae CBS 10118 TaxID=1296100 RepID=A0A1B9FSH4_9TREE|nr:hypothetical protein I302_08498 [Kwoniella bestiolae CBS 10118]OCF21721.1 hypothetical protein I302_08498 [Kwoniella bestiolae CBS 10118]